MHTFSRRLLLFFAVSHGIFVEAFCSSAKHFAGRYSMGDHMQKLSGRGFLQHVAVQSKPLFAAFS